MITLNHKIKEPIPDPSEMARLVTQNMEESAESRARFLSLWRECYDVTLPELAGRGVESASALRRSSLYDGTAPDAVDQLAASLLGQLTPPWVNWVGFGPGVEVQEPDVRDRLARILDHSAHTIQEQIDRSNLHTEIHQCFLDLVIGGTACLAVSENPVGSVCAFAVQAVPMRDVILGADAMGAPTHIYRRRSVRGDVLVTRFTGMEAETLEMISSKPDEEFEIIEFSEQGDDCFYVGVVLALPGRNPVLIASMTRSASPYIVFRWMKTPGEVYGRSPVMKALPDIKTANKVVELILKNASIAVTGIWQAEDDGVLNLATIDLVPGAIIPKAVGSAGLKPLEMPARFDVSQLILSDLRERIRHALLVDRFTQMDMPRLTATEVRERSDEATLILGAIYGRLQAELLTPLVTWIYDLLRGRGEIADLPLDGRMVQIVHRSPLARAQMARGLRGISVWVEALSRLGPEAVQTLNVPAVARYLADIIGIPEGLMQRPTPDPLTSSKTLTSPATQGEMQ